MSGGFLGSIYKIREFQLNRGVFVVAALFKRVQIQNNRAGFNQALGQHGLDNRVAVHWSTRGQNTFNNIFNRAGFITPILKRV
mgnify:CR=1 FL=1